jgi:hypothetical protein
MAWAREWAKEGVAVDWQKLLAPKGFVVLARRWVERTIAWIEKNRRMSKDYERFLCASGEALVYAAMIRLMRRRLACVRGLFIQSRKGHSRKFATASNDEVTPRIRTLGDAPALATCHTCRRCATRRGLRVPPSLKEVG